MRTLYFGMIILSLALITGCQLNQGETMMLLDEKIEKVEVSKSNGVGDVNLNILRAFDDKKSIRIFEKAIRLAAEQKSEINIRQPDYDVVVSYGDHFPKHAIHLWLGNENQKSILMYMVGEGETYVTSTKATNQLRELIEAAE